MQGLEELQNKIEGTVKSKWLINLIKCGETARKHTLAELLLELWEEF